MKTDENEKMETYKWASKEYGIPLAEISGYNSGICYDAIWVTTQKSANIVSEKMKGQFVNGGIYDGMPLGGQSKGENSIRIMC